MAPSLKFSVTGLAFIFIMGALTIILERKNTVASKMPASYKSWAVSPVLIKPARKDTSPANDGIPLKKK